MQEFLFLLSSTILVNNFVLVKFLGLCPFMGLSKRPETAFGMGLATTFVLTVASLCTYLVQRYLLTVWDLLYLRTFAFILTIAVVVQFTEMVLRTLQPTLYHLLGIFLPLITTNCAVLAVALLNTQTHHTLYHSIGFGFGTGCGFALALILFTFLRERLTAADVPLPFQGAPIGFITAGLLSLAFMAFGGWGRG